MDVAVVALAALAVYRLSRMISDEEGPFAVFTKLRGLAKSDTWIGRGLECILCVSVWVSLPATILITVLGYIDQWLWPLTWLALSGVTVIIRKWEQKK
jgi:hypothetical protein